MRIIKLERDPGVNGGKMRKLLSVAAAITLTATTSFAQTTSAPLQINIVPPSTAGFVYPVIDGFTQHRYRTDPGGGGHCCGHAFHSKLGRLVVCRHSGRER